MKIWTVVVDVEMWYIPSYMMYLMMYDVYCNVCTWYLVQYLVQLYRVVRPRKKTLYNLEIQVWLFFSVKLNQNSKVENNYMYCTVHVFYHHVFAVYCSVPSIASPVLFPSHSRHGQCTSAPSVIEFNNTLPISFTFTNWVLLTHYPNIIQTSMQKNTKTHNQR